MKIVITGGLGFVGQNLAHFLRRMSNQCELHCIDWLEIAPKEDHAVFETSSQKCFADPDVLGVYENADVVVHLAATTTVQESIQDPLNSFENNVIKTQRLLDHLRVAAPNAHFVFASTGGAIIGEHDGAIDETIAAKPVSPYGATKLAVEGLLSAYTGSFGMRAASLRFSNVYGPNSARKTSVIAEFCKACLDHRELCVNGDGLQTRDYIYVDDVCDAIWRVIQKRATGTFQLGTGVATSILDLVSILQRLDETKSIAITHAPALNGEVKHNVCDITHATQTLGFRPKYSLERGVDETLTWFQTKAA